MKKSVLLFMFVMVLITACCFMVLQSCGDADDKADKKDDAAEEPGNDAEETPSETAAATPPPTTAEPTTEKPPIVLEEVLRWTFSEEDLIFKPTNQVENLRVEGGLLKLTSIGGDPFMQTINTNLGINASEVNFIKVKVLNHSSSARSQMFFITDEDGAWSESKSFKTDYWNTEGSDWDIIEFDTYDSEFWEGTIKQIRLDPIEGEGDVEIEYISFEKIVK